MKLDINEVYHQYIIKVVVFALFLYKGQIRQPNVYKMSVESFVKRRLPWNIKLSVNTGVKLNTEDERELILDELLYGVENNYQKTVVVKFTTPLKDTKIEVDLMDEKKYEKFLYST